MWLQGIPKTYNKGINRYETIFTNPKLKNPNRVPVHWINEFNKLRPVKDVNDETIKAVSIVGKSKIHLKLGMLWYE